MAKRNSQLTELLIVAQDDYLTIVDTSAGQSKRVSVKNLTGLPDFGWTATGEAWSYSSYNSTLHTGVITVPSDATTKYAVDMWVRFSQTTGGVKWAKIVSITTTTLTVQMSGASVLSNEAITSPVYSPLAHPQGSPADSAFIYTMSNAGAGGGTLYFENKGGVKEVRGNIAAIASGSSAGRMVFPTGFFSTIQSCHTTAGPAAGTAAVSATIDASGLTTVGVYVVMVAWSGAGTMPAQVLTKGV